MNFSISNRLGQDASKLFFLWIFLPKEQYFQGETVNDLFITLLVDVQAYGLFFETEQVIWLEKSGLVDIRYKGSNRVLDA